MRGLILKLSDKVNKTGAFRTLARIWSLIGILVTRIWPARYRQKRYLGAGTFLRGTGLRFTPKKLLDLLLVVAGDLVSVKQAVGFPR